MQNRVQQSTGAIPDDRLAGRICAWRLHKGWDVGELARRAKLSRTTLYHLESGQTRRPHVRTLSKLAEAMGIAVEQLWNIGSKAASGNSCRPPAGWKNDLESQRAFDRVTNPVISEVLADQPELFADWCPEEWDELYSTFGHGGQLSQQGVIAAARDMNRKRETIQQLHVVLETHLGDVAANMIDTLYRMVRQRSNLASTAELAELMAQHEAQSHQPPPTPAE